MFGEFGKVKKGGGNENGSLNCAGFFFLILKFLIQIEWYATRRDISTYIETSVKFNMSDRERERVTCLGHQNLSRNNNWGTV